MILTTTPSIEGHRIKEYKGLVSGEVIFGMHFLKDIGASLHDFFGGRTSSYEQDMHARPLSVRWRSVPVRWEQMRLSELVLVTRRWAKLTV